VELIANNSKGYAGFLADKKVRELVNLEVPVNEVTFWDTRITNEKRREILAASGFEFVKPETPWANLNHGQRELIKMKVRNLVRGYSSFLGIEVVNV
tara:strand:+ start:1828 stop:2118 length:291 start_codon:yes stop_codon:yes gene_type:complete